MAETPPPRTTPRAALRRGDVSRPEGRGRGRETSARSPAASGWLLRLPVLLWMAWILYHYWDSPGYSTLWSGIDLAFHEIGHYLWAPLGRFWGVAGGTLTQCLIPVAAGAVLYRQRDWFGVAVAVCWLGINCFEIVPYAADALTRRLPLVSPGPSGAPIHDWWFMLGRLGMLDRAQDVARAWQMAGRLIMTAGIAFGTWVLWRMATTPRGGGGDPELATTAQA